MQKELKQGQLKILKAVATLLENPNTKITVASVAAEVGVTDAAIYRHYRSKEQIFQALMDYVELNFLSPLNSVQADHARVDERLERLFQYYLDFFAGHPGLARLFLGHSAHEGTGLGGRLQHLHAKIRSQVAQILRHGQADNRLRAGITPEQGTELFYGLVVATATSAAHNLPQLAADQRWAAFASGVLA